MNYPRPALGFLVILLAGITAFAPNASGNSILSLDEWSSTKLVATLDGEPVDVENLGPHAWNVLVGIPTGPSPAHQSITDFAGWPEPGDPTRGNFIGGFAFLDSGVLFWGLTVLSDLPVPFSLYSSNGFLALGKIKLTDAFGTERFLDVRYTDHSGATQPVPDSSSGLGMLLLAAIGLAAFSMTATQRLP